MPGVDTSLRTMDTIGIKDKADAVRKIFASLMLTKKNCSLYPEGHTISVNAVNNTHAQLDAFLNAYKEMRVDIARDQILFQEEVVLSSQPQEGMLPFILFRDGIRWLSFTQGLQPEELHEFVRILNRYNIITNESEGDIVTALWEVRLPHVDYEVVDFSWSFEQESDLSFEMKKPGEHDSALSLREHLMAEWEPLTDPAIEQDSIIMNSQDLEAIKGMVRSEEEADPTEYLDALFDSLLGHREKENFEIIIEMLGEELNNALAQRDFEVPLKILRNMQHILDNVKVDTHWIRRLIDDFICTVSGSESMKYLKAVWPEIDVVQIPALKQFLSMLHPEAIHPLAELVTASQPARLRSTLHDAIHVLALKDHRPLEPFLRNPDDKTAQMLVHVFGKLQGEQARKVLVKLVRHTSEQVRQDALKALLQMGSVFTRDIFKLIDDKDDSIRRLILNQIGQSRDHVVEGLLLDYLEHREFQKDESTYVIDCFIALGRCGSSRSVPFLRKTLFYRGWMPGFWRVAHRKGAAIALSILGINESRKVLEEAGKCLYPSVRRIVRKMNEDHARGKGA